MSFWRATLTGAAAGHVGLNRAGPLKLFICAFVTWRTVALSRVRIQVRPQLVAAAVSPSFGRSQSGLALRREQPPPYACCTVFSADSGRRLQYLSLCPSRDAAPLDRTQYPALSLLHNGRLTPVVRAARLLSPKIAPPSERTTARARRRARYRIGVRRASARRHTQTSRPPQPCACLCYSPVALVDAAIAGCLVGK